MGRGGGGGRCLSVQRFRTLEEQPPRRFRAVTARERSGLWGGAFDQIREDGLAAATSRDEAPGVG